MPMSYPVRVLCLVLLLVAARQGALVHELSHGITPSVPGVDLKTAAAGEGGCAVCPVFAEALTPAFSHAFTLPTLARTPLERLIVAPFEFFAAPAPTVRSRGPPLTR